MGRVLKIVFTADSHLNKHYARMTPDQLAERRARLRGAWKATVDHALTEGAQVYIHGGDLFDGPNPRATEMIWAAEQFRRLHEAGLTTLLIGGNHDIPKTRHGGTTPQRLFETVGMAHVFNDPTAVTWWTGERAGLRLAVGGLPPDPRLDPELDPLEALAESIDPPAADCVLLVTHYAVEGLLHPLANEPVIRRESIARLRGRVDALLVGHIHSDRTLDVAGLPVVFPGPTERLSFGELELRCGFASLTVDPHGVEKLRVRHVPLRPQPMHRETVRATDLPAAEPTAWLVERLRALSDPEQILQLALEGPLPRAVYHAIRFREIWQLGNELNFYFDLDRHALTVAGDEGLAHAGGGQRLNVRGELTRVGQALLAAAEDATERELRREALDLVLTRYGADTVVDG